MMNRGTFKLPCGFAAAVLVLWCGGGVGATAAESPALPPADQRFASADATESPSFQRHVVNLFGRLGCNGRACHGSFQGRGGFQLSLFGYDFKTDHDALFAKDRPRVDLAKPDESLIIAKPTDADEHEGGQRYAKGSWQHHLLRRWIESGAKLPERPDKLVRLQVTPAELAFSHSGEQTQLQAIAIWEDGSREDVTPLCRFQTNDDVIAKISETGLVTAGETGDTHVVVSYDNGVTSVPVLRPVSDLVGDKFPPVPTPTKIDELVVAKLRKLGVVPAELCSDAEFLRRVRLDLTGTLPTAAEVEAFLADGSPDKRSRKIDALLATPAYAAWWATKLCDFTGNNDEQLLNAGPLRGQASQDWYDWIYRRVAANTPYDQLVAGILTAVSRQPGQSYSDFCREMSVLYRQGADRSFADLPSLPHYWTRRDFRDPEARVVAVAYSFMGLRIQCAQCHKHPFDQWSKDDFHQFKNFFASVAANGRAAGPEGQREYNQIVQELGLQDKRGNDLQKELPRLLNEGKTIPFPEVAVTKPAGGRGPGGNKNKTAKTAPGSATAKLLGGDVVDLTQCDDPRAVVMDWLRAKDNRFFARAFVNRVWAAYFNVGIVQPPDDISLANPPSNGPLLDYLAEGFIASGFDMRWVHRQIASSRTYQLSWQTNETNRLDERNFSHAVARRLPAEVLYDAIQQATASDAKIAQWEENVRGRAITIPGTGARNARAGGAAYAMTVFGRSTRNSNCDCDRSSEASLLQTVYLQNDRDVLQLIDIRQGGWLDEIAQRIRPAAATPQPAGGGNSARRLDAQITALRDRAKTQRQAGNADNADRMEKRIAALEQERARLEPAAQPASEPASAVPAVDVQPILRQAYLRTVSRYPTDAERQRCAAYFAEAGDPVDGVRDVLWALLNTKEFLLNH